MVNIRATRTRQDVRDELGVPPDSVLIGTAARLTAVKAQDDFIRAAQLMLARHPNFRFVLVGEGPEERTLKALARQMGIEGHIVFAGGRRDVHDLIAAMDVFVLPSLAEGMPMALLEAMALGTPVVATAVGGVPELIAHQSNGMLVPARDPGALADACVELALNRTRRRTWPNAPDRPSPTASRSRPMDPASSRPITNRDRARWSLARRARASVRISVGRCSWDWPAMRGRASPAR